ncbi:MAG: hypothetical protein COA52_00715 [Hyphomicrobiales bacterium]|nr:MAG: hypothetical protein COA52_00715 [Hyphomicrobiales bacterium]
MSFSVSPAITVREFDLSGYVSNISITIGALAGVFNWGPVDDRELISSEPELVQRFGKPTSSNYETFFVGADYLSYSDKLYVSRAADANSFNAVATVANTVANTTIKNETHYTQTFSSLPASALYYAKYPSDLGNSLKISVCDSANAFYSTFTGNSSANVAIDFTINSNVATLTTTGANNAVSDELANTIITGLQVGDILTAGSNSIGKQFMKVSSIDSIASANGVSTVDINLTTRYSLGADSTQTTVERNWEYYNLVDLAPGTSAFVGERNGTGDEMHVVVIDEDGDVSDVPGTVLEVFESLSRATGAKSEQGGSIYYKDALNQSSKYIWYANDRAGSPSNTSVNMVALDTYPLTLSLTGGTDSLSESAIPLASLANAYDQFKNAEDVDVSVIMAGKAVGGVHGEGVANYISDNITEIRRDCVVVISPQLADVVDNPFGETEDTVQFRNALRSSTYSFLDSGYKYRYDRYNDTHRWVPMNGDVAGTFSRTDKDRDPWWSPAGYSRGTIKNVVKLAFNPNKANRDILYKNGVNPIIHKKGRGVVLFGDKTLSGKKSAFDRINVRRLFIVLEKAIATASEDLLFEFNDAFTRSQFRNMVVPYLRDIQGRRGIYEFRVVCDETNNTGEIIDNNQFIGDIYIKPAKSINEIVLNFVAVRTGVEFEEVVGKFGG